MSVAEWIDSRVAGGRKSSIGALLDVAYAIEYGADTTDQSALNFVYLLGAQRSRPKPGQGFNVFGESDERYHIRGGNQQLPARIAKHLRTPVQLGMRMTSIARNGDGTYALSFDGHPSVAADLVILSLPFAVLRKIDTSGAGFDARKNTAIQELGRGQSGKLQLQFTSRYWREAGPWPGRGNGLSYTDEGYQNTWEVSRRQFGASGLLNNYTGGSATAAKITKTPFATAADADVQQDANAFLGWLESVFPGGTTKWNGRAASLAAGARSEYGGVLFLLAGGPIHVIRRLREGAARSHSSSPANIARRLPGFHGGRRGRRRARGEGDPGPASREEDVGAALGRRSVWVFLGAGRLSAKTPVFGGWKSLDFLGFSRPNRAFSMGYTGFSLKEISRALCPSRGGARTRVHGGLGHADAQNYSRGKPSVISAFRPSIVARLRRAPGRLSHTSHDNRRAMIPTVAASGYTQNAFRRPRAPIMRTQEAGIASLQVAANVQSNRRYRQKSEKGQHRPCVTRRQFWQGPPHRSVWAWRPRRRRAPAP